MLASSPTKQDFDREAFKLALSDSNASPELLAAFRQAAIKLTCTGHRVLFQKGEPGSCVYLVLTGEVGLMLPVQSNRGIGFLAKSGSLVGLPAAFSKEPYSMTAVAWEGTELAVMSREKFCDMIAVNPLLSMDVVRILAAETRTARIAIIESLKEQSRTTQR